jgi:hypothetical protein
MSETYALTQYDNSNPIYTQNADPGQRFVVTPEPATPSDGGPTREDFHRDLRKIKKSAATHQPKD